VGARESGRWARGVGVGPWGLRRAAGREVESEDESKKKD
jgi:hypothetical protein